MWAAIISLISSLISSWLKSDEENDQDTDEIADLSTSSGGLAASLGDSIGTLLKGAPHILGLLGKASVIKESGGLSIIGVKPGDKDDSLLTSVISGVKDWWLPVCVGLGTLIVIDKLTD